MTDTEPFSGRPASSRTKPAYAKISSPYLQIMVALFVGVMLISNITTTKPVVFAPSLHLDLLGLHIEGIATDGAFYLFPLAYVLGDVISEVYGFRAMRRVILSGFAILALAAGCFWLTTRLPGAPGYDPSAFETVAGVVPRFLLAGLAGYLVGELMNSYVLVKMKAWTGERMLWSRLLGSTVVGEFFDTLVFCSIAAPALGFTSAGQFLNYTILGFLWKTLVEILIMPISYLTCWYVKRREPSYQAALRGETSVTGAVL
ncbi:queuosine precursor transporter [Tsukamurella sp. 8F]|uniref:queuosine precursor transporter n=1 Tax=unclassified Tsukamurella TaxID=2633480 RepID=UPI0023B95853|nr:MULTISPECIES: queuosine precursor transporter [unclassified Tsukamurella]MDF0530170.1 queuosine precursor transporter [Tsukamurella sp. 8J]MDF0586488.1 queuosine precursor transporter [Tsukamurella sp. 8F]